MDNTVNKFLDLYKKATDTEYEIFEAKLDPMMQVGSAEYKLLETKTEEFKKFKFELSNIQLSVEQATFIITQSDKISDGFHSMSEIQGSDCYRFMNKGIKQNTSIALLAVRDNPGMDKYIPEEVRERLDRIDMSKLAEGLMSVVGASRENTQTTPKQSTRLERKLGLSI